MSKYSDFKRKSLENPEIEKAYDELQPEYDIIQALIKAKKKTRQSDKRLNKRLFN